MIMNKKEAKGFTLLELLIVIAILAILSVTLVLVLNPAESMKKSRDTRRLSDLTQVKSALGIYMTTVASPNLAQDGVLAANQRCLLNGSTPSIYYSATFTDATVAGGITGTNVIKSTATTTDGNGWLPVNLDAITGGSPISNFPLDPVNSVVNGGSADDGVKNDALVYRYGCNKTNLTFEINAKLESSAFTTEDNMAAKDGGNNTNLYEVGTAMNILPASDDF